MSASQAVEQRKLKLLREAWFRKIEYTPHPEQQLYHNSLARFRAPCCGRRFGKSLMAARDLVPKLFLPEKRFWIVGPTYSLGEKEFRVVWQDLIVKQKLGRDPRIKKSYSPKQGDMYIEFTDRNTILEVKSADNTDTLVGDALDGVIMSEAAKHKKDTWDRYIRPALSDKRGFADFPTTPEGFNWYYDLWLLGRDNSLPDYDSWRFPSWKNTFVFPDGENDSEIVLQKRTMTTESFNQEVAADFSSFVGQIYPEWDVNTHVQNQVFNPNWPNYIAFDWGYTNPLAAVEFQISPWDTVHIWRLVYKSHTTLEKHLNDMKNRVQPDGYHINMTFGDAADPEAVATVNEKFAPCIASPDAKTNWREGIDLVRSFLERQVDEDEYGGPIYAPALFVDPTLTDIIREFNNYRSPESATGKNVTEMGIKQDDHALDALRYGLVHIYKLGATSSLADTMDLGRFVSPVVTQQKITKALEGPTNGAPTQLVPNLKQMLPGIDTNVGSLFGSDSGYFTTLGEF
jgi:hypothetical protein